MYTVGLCLRDALAQIRDLEHKLRHQAKLFAEVRAENGIFAAQIVMYEQALSEARGKIDELQKLQRGLHARKRR